MLAALALSDLMSLFLHTHTEVGVILGPDLLRFPPIVLAALAGDHALAALALGMSELDTIGINEDVARSS